MVFHIFLPDKIKKKLLPEHQYAGFNSHHKPFGTLFFQVTWLFLVAHEVYIYFDLKWTEVHRYTATNDDKWAQEQNAGGVSFKDADEYNKISSEPMRVLKWRISRGERIQYHGKDNYRVNYYKMGNGSDETHDELMIWNYITWGTLGFLVIIGLLMGWMSGTVSRYCIGVFMNHCPFVLKLLYPVVTVVHAFCYYYVTLATVESIDLKTMENSIGDVFGEDDKTYLHDSYHPQVLWYSSFITVCLFWVLHGIWFQKCYTRYIHEYAIDNNMIHGAALRSFMRRFRERQRRKRGSSSTSSYSGSSVSSFSSYSSYSSDGKGKGKKGKGKGKGEKGADDISKGKRKDGSKDEKSNAKKGKGGPSTKDRRDSGISDIAIEIMPSADHEETQVGPKKKKKKKTG